MKMTTRIGAVVMILVMLTCSFAMADSVVDTIMNVGTTQAFSDEAVSMEDLNTILRAGMAAASAINQQPWFFVAVANKDVMSEISGAGAGFAAPAGASMPEGFTAPEGTTAGTTDGASSGMPAGTTDGASSGMPAGTTDGASSGMPAGTTDGASSGMPAGMTGMPASTGSAKAALGDTPAAIIIYMNQNTSSPNANFDCGLAAQNMYLAAASLGYGVKIVSSPTSSLNGANHAAICEKLGVDPSYTAVAVLLIGKQDTTVDAASSATTRADFSEKVSIVE